MSVGNPDRIERQETPVISYAGNPPYGSYGWLLTFFAIFLVALLFVLDSDSVRAVLSEKFIDTLAVVRGWAIIFSLLVVAVRVFTVVFPPRAFRLWRDRTPIGKYGRKFARNWRRIIPALTPVSTGVVVRRHYPGLVSATAENNQLVLTVRYPNERPSGGLAQYADDIAESFHDAFQFASVTAVPVKPGALFNRFKLAITPTDLTEEVREWNGD